MTEKQILLRPRPGAIWNALITILDLPDAAGEEVDKSRISRSDLRSLHRNHTMGVYANGIHHGGNFFHSCWR